MSMVLAKFRVVKISHVEAWVNGKVEAHEIQMAPVQGEPFGPATPSGQVQMLILHDAAAEQFHLGKEYFVTFKLDDGTGPE